MRHLALVLLVACNGDPKPTLVLDEAVVADVLTTVTTVVPNCDVGSTEAARTPPTGPQYAGTGSTGACGGSLDVTFNHESGVTDYDVTLADLCLTGPQGDMTWSGGIAATEIGTPSDDGPIIKAFELSTVGDLTILTGGETVTASITDARADYGDPQPWYPGLATEAKPNVVEVDTIAVDLGGDAYTLTGLRYEAVGEFMSTSIAVTGGLLEGPGGTVTVRTNDGAPLAIMVAGGAVTAGGLVLGGADDTEVVLTPVDGSIGVFDITVNGAAYPDRLDCVDAIGPTGALTVALMSALPIY
jgi:hypothetical protein